MRTETTLNSTSNHSILSVEARTRAKILNARKQQNRLSRRQTIHGALEGILGEHIGDDWSLDGESFCSATSRQSAPAAPNGAGSTRTRYARRGSVTKFSLDPSTVASEVPKSIKAKNNSTKHDDDISLCSQLSEENSQKSSNSRRRYGRRGSVTKYSLEPAITAATEADNHLNNSHSDHEAFETSSVQSGTSHSSFPEIPVQCAGTIDSLPIPMKHQLRKPKKKKSKDSISKYSKDSIKEDILAASMHKKDSDRKKKQKKRASKLDKKTDKNDDCPDSPDSTAAKTCKKKKKELKLRKDKQQQEDEVASVSTTADRSEASSKRRHKRRCSVTKYNLAQEVENQMDSGFSGPIPVVEAPSATPEQEEEITKQVPPSDSDEPPRRHHRRRTSVTAYTPGIMEAAEKSPGVLKRTSVTAYTPGIMEAAEKSPGALRRPPMIHHDKTSKSAEDEKKSPGVHRRRNSITKHSLEQSKPKNFPAAA